MSDYLKNKPEATKSTESDYLDSILQILIMHGLLPRDKTFPFVPEIRDKAPECLKAIFNSSSMAAIPVSDFKSGAKTALKYSFAFGVLMGESWHTNFANFNQMKFSIVNSDVETAAKSLEMSMDNFETLVFMFNEKIVKTINQKENADLRMELNFALIAAQTAGTALFLNKHGFK